MIKIFVIIAMCLLPLEVIASDPLVYSNNLTYLGAFKTPTGDDYSYGGSVITYNPSNNSLFMVGHINQQKVAEISIPTPVNSSDLASLNRATTLQALSDITEGNRRKIAAGGASLDDGNNINIGGLLVYGGNLIGTSYAFYSTAGVLSHFTSGTTLATTGDFAGMYAVGSAATGTPTASFVDGYMSMIPSAYQTALGGPALTGNGSLSILSRTSFGPAAFSFDPARLGVDTPVAATPLLYYPQDHQLSGTTTNPVWNDTTKMAGMVFVPGTRTVLYFGYHGIGPRNYGQWSTDPIFADTCTAPDACTTGPNGWPICSDMDNCTTGRKGIPYDTACLGSGSDGCYYDPSGMGAKGPHAYPYIYQVWAYSVDDLADVNAGTKNPWEVMPYAIWTLPMDVKPTDQFGGAAAYDPTTGRLYVSQPNGEKYGLYQNLAVIHVFQLDLSSTPSATYQIKPTVMLLNGTVKLKNNGGEEITVTASTRATTQSVSFSTGIAPSSTYSVTVSEQPSGQACTVINGSGTVSANSDIKNIVVYCNGAGSSAVSGLCGPSNGLSLSTSPTVGLCFAGTASTVTGSGPWSWTCAGSGGGSTANCGATLLEVPPVGNASAVVACPVMAGFR